MKAKKICINKIYDINEPLAHNILVMEENKYEIKDILNSMNPNTYEKDVMHLLANIIKGFQFFHLCGYLYRNVRP